MKLFDRILKLFSIKKYETLVIYFHGGNKIVVDCVSEWKVRCDSSGALNSVAINQNKEIAKNSLIITSLDLKAIDCICVQK